MKLDPISAILPPIGYGGARPAPARPFAPTGKPSPGAAGQSIWSRFWQDFSLENQPSDRCYIPGDGRDAVDRHWTRFADELPNGARVIDLGCGAGIAGNTLLRRRGDLEVAGVDLANVPVTRLANLTIHPWTNMEALPFGEGCFDAAISLFGVEYGDIGKTARELERVLKPGAAFSFLVHHHESEIAREGGARRRALRELIAGKLKAAFLAGDMKGIEQQRQRLREHYPREPAVSLFSEHYRRNVTRTRAERQALWQKLAAELDPEIALLLHLKRSAKAPAELGAWLVPLLSGMARGASPCCAGLRRADRLGVSGFR